MTRTQQETLEHLLAQDLRRFRVELLDREPTLGKGELQKRLMDYENQRRRELAEHLRIDPEHETLPTAPRL